jgi:thiol-disulfide isomerase/thioredoxin
LHVCYLSNERYINRNVNKGNWKAEYQKEYGKWPTKCQISGCENDAQVGGHMYAKGHNNNSNFILPICQEHNRQPDLECADNKCPKYVATKNNTNMLGIHEYHQTQAYRAKDQVYQRSKHMNGARSMKTINDINRIYESLKYPEHTTYYFLVMDGCYYCEKIKPKVERFANEVTNHRGVNEVKFYLVNEKIFGNRDPSSIFKIKIEGFPVILCLKPGKKIKDITNRLSNLR